VAEQGWREYRGQHSLGARRHGVRKLAEDSFHHRQVLKIVVRLKRRFSSEQLQQDAADAPQIARVCPTQS